MPLDRDPAASTRRIVVRAALLLAPLVLGAVAAPFVVSHLRGARAPEERSDRPPTEAEIRASARADRELGRTEERNWAEATHLAPREARRDASGEVTGPFQGFGVSVESEPPGARVVVNGEELGETPLVASVRCTPGDAVRVRIEKPPLRAVERVTTCRADTRVELEAKLAR